MSERSDIQALFVAEAPRLRLFLRRFGPAISPEDVAQEAFAQLCQIDTSQVSSLRGYLFRTARNLALNQIKRAKIAPVRTVEDAILSNKAGSALSPEEARAQEEESIAVKAVIALLPEAEREALMLRKLEGLSPSEIGIRLGLGPRQVQRLILSALAKIKAGLEDDDISGFTR